MDIKDSNIPHCTKLTKAIFDAFEQEMVSLTEEMQASFKMLLCFYVLIRTLDRQQFLAYASQVICGLILILLAT